MSFSDVYRTRMNRVGDTRRKRSFSRKEHEFNLYYADTLNKEKCLIDGNPVEAVFQDQSQSNNKDLSDDKYLVIPNSIKAEVGSYVEWRDADWLVFTKEYKTIPTHQQMKIKHVNRKIKWMIVDDNGNRTICNSGNGWGAYVQNQTLYTLGVSFSGEHLPLANGKESIYIQDNPETRKVAVGTRLYVAGQVYKIEFVDFVSRTGLINWLLDEDTKNPETDNFDLGIADYWEKSSDSHKKTNDKPTEPENGEKEWKIDGEERARLGKTYVYSAKDADGNDVHVEEWTVGDPEQLPFYVLEKNEQSITVRVKDDFRMVGHVATIAAKANGTVKNITIKIIKKFG